MKEIENNIYYKFLPPDRITYFDDELIRFTQPSDLNDPFECIPQKITKEELQEGIKKSLEALGLGMLPDDYDFSQHNIDEMFQEAKKKVNNDIGVFSLSKDWKNCLMWAHYTNSYKGFCVGFDKSHEFFTDYLSEDKKTSKKTMEVIYSSTRVEIRKTIFEELTFDLFITKSLDWRYEKEVRMIATLNLAEKIIEKKPYSICLFKVPHGAVKEIILGINTQEEYKNKIMEFAKFKNIEVYNSELSDTKFEITKY